MEKGIFISLDGPDGSGKSSIVRKLHEHYSKSINCVMTKDPGGTSIGDKIRSIIVSPENKDIEHLTELYLFYASRTELMNKIIIPNIDEGNMIITDRFFDSTWIYQGYVRGWDKKILQQFDNLTNRGIVPDLTILCNVDAEIGLRRSLKNNSKRIQDNGDDESRFELEGIEFHKKINEGFLKRAKKFPKRFVILDSNNHSIEELSKQAIEIIDKRFFKNNC
jgi:dTMP kinase